MVIFTYIQLLSFFFFSDKKQKNPKTTNQTNRKGSLGIYRGKSFGFFSLRNEQ